VQLPQDDIDFLMSRCEELPSTQIVVNVAEQTVSVQGTDWKRSFGIDPFVKHRLLNGLDDVGLTMQHTDVIGTFEETRNPLKPTTERAFADTLKM
jgi:3-isopropylmalate/(R)-2-methylmalate dehydratase small subunit